MSTAFRTGVVLKSEKDQPNGYAGLNADAELVGRIILRQDTAVGLAAVVPDLGETVYETDTKLFKIGDGVTACASLASVNKLTARYAVTIPTGNPNYASAPLLQLPAVEQSCVTIGTSGVWQGSPMAPIWLPLATAAGWRVSVSIGLGFEYGAGLPLISVPNINAQIMFPGGTTGPYVALPDPIVPGWFIELESINFFGAFCWMWKLDVRP